MKITIECKDDLTAAEIEQVTLFANTLRQQGPYDTSHWHKVPPSNIVETAPATIEVAAKSPTV